MYCQLIPNSSVELIEDASGGAQYEIRNHGLRLIISHISDYLMQFLASKDLVLALKRGSFY